MSYPPPPPPNVPAHGGAGKPALRGRTPLRLGIIFLVLGVAGIIVGGLVAYQGGLSKVDGFSRVPVSTTTGEINTGSAKFGTGGYLAYYESRSATTRSIPGIRVRITSPSGTQTVLQTPYGGTSGGRRVKPLSYDFNGHHGVALWQFTIREPGTYKLEVQGSSRADPDAQIAFGRSIGKSTAAGGLLVALGALLLIAGIVLLVIGLVKRSRSKKELARAQAYYGTPGGYLQSGPGGYGQQQPSAYPPPGYQPGYPPAGGQPGYPPPGGQPGYPPPGGQPGYPQQGYGALPPGQSPPDNPWPPKD